MQISKCSMHIRFLSKTLKISLYKFQDMYNNFKYGFQINYSDQKYYYLY